MRRNWGAFQIKYNKVIAGRKCARIRIVHITVHLLTMYGFREEIIKRNTTYTFSIQLSVSLLPPLITSYHLLNADGIVVLDQRVLCALYSLHIRARFGPHLGIMAVKESSPAILVSSFEGSTIPGTPAPVSRLVSPEKQAPIMEVAGKAVVASGVDAGNRSDGYYKRKLLPLRYRLRKLALPVIEWELTTIARIQTKMRHPWLDFYFAWTANLALHTFYVMLFPMPVWFGCSFVMRDMVQLVGYGIWATGFLKDWLCMPRPMLPPLHRITMLSYTTQEYGFPSSHAANATAMTLLGVFKVLEYGKEWLQVQWWGAMFVCAIYYFSLIIGRIYCGMHGFFDLGLGIIVGLTIFAFRHWIGPHSDHLLFYNSLPAWVLAIIVIGFGTIIIHVYPEPADDCPCFDDLVAFIGVIIGLDLSHIALVRTGYLTLRNRYQDPLLIWYDYQQLGLLGSFFRLVAAIGLVALWKAISKPVVFAILVPVYKRLNLWIPRANYKSTAHSTAKNTHIRRQLILNVGGEESEFIHDVISHPHDQVGMSTAGVFKKRYDVEIVGRLIIYAGIPFMAIWGFVGISLLLRVNCIDLLVSF